MKVGGGPDKMAEVIFHQMCVIGAYLGPLQYQPDIISNKFHANLFSLFFFFFFLQNGITTVA
jgi:hypothetical protein